MQTGPTSQDKILTITLWAAWRSQQQATNISPYASLGNGHTIGGLSAESVTPISRMNAAVRCAICHVRRIG